MDTCDGSPSPGNNHPDDHTWLAFSLSNRNYFPPSNHSSLSLFQHTTNNPHTHLSPGEVAHVGDGASNHQHDHHHELSITGGAGGGGRMLQVGLFPAVDATAAVTVARSNGSTYETVPEHTFLGGFVGQQQEEIMQQGKEQGIVRDITNKQHHQQQQQEVAVVEPSTIVTAISSSIKKAVEGLGNRTSIYRGVTRHRWTGRYEAHLWDNSCRREGQSRKGRQVYLGGYDKEVKAARAYDLAALKYWGPTTTTNFQVTDYEKELEEMQSMSRQEFVASLRRKSSGFSRGASIYRGVTRHHQHGRWQARIGRVAGNKDLYLGTFSTQEEAAEAYDIAAIKFRGLNAVTNFDISRYDVKSIISSNLPVGGMSKTRSNSDQSGSSDIKPLNAIPSENQELTCTLPFTTSPTTLSFAIPIKPNSSSHNYNLPALGTLDHNEPIGYGLVYPNQPISVVGDDNNTHTPTNQGYDNGCGVVNDDGNGNASSNGTGNSWIVTPGLHTFQSSKQSLSVLQTAIFGIE